MSERETVVELPFAADCCPCVEKLRTVLPYSVGIRDGAVGATLGSVVREEGGVTCLEGGGLLRRIGERASCPLRRSKGAPACCARRPASARGLFAKQSASQMQLRSHPKQQHTGTDTSQ
jgi:hypothetical protein